MYLVHIINTELGRGSAKQVGDNTATRWLNDKKKWRDHKVNSCSVFNIDFLSQYKFYKFFSRKTAHILKPPMSPILRSEKSTQYNRVLIPQ